MTGILAASILAPLFLEVTPEVRSSYVSLGKLMEDRPMQITNIRAGYDTGSFGRFGLRNWDVSSITDRRSDAHRHVLYHTEVGVTWQYDLEIADNWKLKNDLTRSWTLYRGFDDRESNRSYQFWQIDQSLENPYIVPFYRTRRTFRGNDYLYFKAGVRRKFNVWSGLSITPSVFAEGGSYRTQKRVLGRKPDGGRWKSGVSSVSFRLEAAWRFSEEVSVFAYVEQYEISGASARSANGASSYRCAHNDWTHGGIGVRMSF